MTDVPPRSATPEPHTNEALLEAYRAYFQLANRRYYQRKYGKEEAA